MTLLRSKSQRALYWKTIDRLQSNSVKRSAGLAFNQLIRDKNKAALAVSKSTDSTASFAASEAMANQAQDWTDLFVQIYTANFLLFGARVVGQFQKADTDLIDPAVRSRWDAIAIAYVESTAVQRIPGMLGNSNRTIQRVIANGFADGLGIDQIARNIRAQESNFSQARATTIARTEVIAAANLGSMAGAAEVDPRSLKEWISTPGPRTRATHAAIDGQTRPLDKPFDVGGFQVMFPGDTSLGAPASETINERCTLAYIPQPVQMLSGIG